MNNTRKIALLILLIFTVNSCTNDSQDDLIDHTLIEGNITYNLHIKSIVQNNCLNCHSNPPQNGAPMSLTTYSQVKNAVLNRNLIGRLNNTVNPMPPTGNLPNATIDLFEEWLNNGLLE